jgi:hypothetical protein
MPFDVRRALRPRKSSQAAAVCGERRTHGHNGGDGETQVMLCALSLPTKPLRLSEAGRSVLVSSMPLKGSGETRGKPPKGRAWLRDHMVSTNEAGFNLRGIQPLSQDLARWDSQCVGSEE